jgi:general secretion pathway protein G
LAILAGLVLPKVTGTGTRARVQATQTQLKAFAQALDMFEVDNGYYPKGANGLNDLVVQPRNASNWHQYMDKIPLDPWGHPYTYSCPGKHRANSYDISSAGPDGQTGNEDDITNWDK